MANNTIQLKRSSVAGKQPNTSTLAVGELALNLTDQKLYSSNGTGVFEPAGNVSSLYVGNSSVYTTVNSTAFSGTSNNSNYLGGTAAAGYQTTAGLSANVATLTSNNASYLGGVAAASYVNTSGAYTIGGIYTHSANIVINNNVNLNFKTLSGNPVSFIQQNDDNFVMYSTNTAGSQRAVWAVYANSITSDFNVVIPLRLSSALTVGGSNGTAGQVLTSNGNSPPYWSTVSGGGSVNVASQYTWTNTQTFTNTITFNSTIVGTVNNSLYLGGTAAAGYQTTAGLAANVATLTANAATYLNGQLSSYYTNATNITTGTLPWAQAPSGSVNTSGNFTIAGNLNFTATNTYFTSTAYIGGQIVIGAAGDIILANGSGIQANGTWGTAGQALLTDGSGNDYWGVPTVLTANNASYLGGTAAAGYQTTAGLSANVATLTANNTSFVGSVTAANVVSNAQLSANLANYAPLGGATFTGAVVVSNNLTVTGNLTLSGNTVIVGANNLIVQDAVFSLHTLANLAPWTVNDGKLIGTAYHYYDTADKQALLVVNPSNTFLTYYNTSTDAALGDPTGTTLGTIQANTFYAGNSSVYATVNATTYTGSANNASYLGGVAAASYVNTSAAYTITGVHTYNANVVIGTTAGISANGSYGTANQVLTSNGTSVYWSTVSSGGAGGTTSQQQYTGDGTTTVFTFTGGYTANKLQVYLNGVLLRNGTEVTVTSGSTFTITPAPVSGDLIDAIAFSNINSSGASTVVSQQFTANGSANSFTVTGGYIPSNIQVYLNGVKQIPGTDVVITSGNTVNFAVTPANTYIVDVYGYQNAVTLTSNTLVVSGSITVNGASVATTGKSIAMAIVFGG